jgi:hypothetical protein
MMSQEELKVDSPYYRVIFQMSRDDSLGVWVGKARIRRRDTDEIVRGGFKVVDSNKTVVEEKANIWRGTACVDQLGALGVPYEWNSPVRPILVRYLKLQRSNTRFWLRVDDVFSGKQERTAFSEYYSGYWTFVATESVELTKAIEVLTTRQRVDMLISPGAVFDDPSDPWSLDDIDARVGIFKFFIRPSQDEVQAHQTQLAKLDSRYKELGWVPLGQGDVE